MRPSAFNPFASYTWQPRCLLQAHRVWLYVELPVPDGWREAHARGAADTGRYQHRRRRCMAYD